MANSARPPRAELFTFYFLGFNPEGEYHFPNIHHVARYYNTSGDMVQKWLDDLNISPAEVLRRDCNLAEMQMDLQFEAEALTPDLIRERGEEILARVDQARPTRKPWEDSPFH